MTFLGLCRWFETRGEEKKEIPGTIADRGCKYWKPKENEDETLDAECVSVAGDVDGVLGEPDRAGRLPDADTLGRG